MKVHREPDSSRPDRADMIERRLARVEAMRKWLRRTGRVPLHLTLDAYAVAGGTLDVYREMQRGTYKERRPRAS